MSKCIGGVAHDAVGSLATHQPSKSLGDLFEEKKAELDTLQASFSTTIMPKTPSMPAVKYRVSTLKGTSIIILAYPYRYITRKHNVWARDLDIYGRTHSEVGEAGFIPFLYQGQHLDGETGLAYNRFRYYSPETGAYISQDPIRLEAGLFNLYAYVHDVNAWVDPLGLIIVFRGERSKNSPDKIFKEGFRPKGKHTNLLMHTQSNTTPGDFISSSKSVDIAKGFASKNGYIYVIDTNNGIDVDDVLGVESLYPKQLEVSIRGYIPSEDIVGVYPVVKGKVGDQMIENPNYKGSSSNHINSTTH